MHSANREFVTSCCHGGKFPGWQQTDNATWKVNLNTPFPSSIKSHFQNEAKCETFVVKMSFICIIIKNHFHINGFALSLALKVRFFGTRKWPIALFQTSTILFHFIKLVKFWQNFVGVNPKWLYLRLEKKKIAFVLWSHTP